ncbi:TPA: glycosyltransferase [Klebsiella pneumoniae]|uniref:glycosyltransferase n=1 Tax=Klebsiella pneumoniae TaxID=573 RepID=UPI00111DE08E|nr:glycosyltransferase [Klebsiella pneumoniae]EKJ5234340.1 glycosyltransferase [Klebsiella pneumoniae]EKV7523888.1 glycosyltransferase [Klebsiella pneumoniae]EKW8850599.1 glycosyltransferase [Klebsiella pneumoniae]EKW8856284.1 glycosyltransferase [Klebsiella pneumoniae]EKW8862186.1 glycosyltransferase [Klebsiella pneumoniae]
MISVNLTTTSARVDLCSATVWSILQQDLIPDRINIWVSENAYLFDEGIKNPPSWVYELNKLNDIIRIIYTENTGPYRKIIPALSVAKRDDILVYCDDDVIYGNKWLRCLIDEYNYYNGKYVVASRVRLKKKNIIGKYKSYNLYPIIKSDSTIESDYIITGVGGCVVNKEHFNQAHIGDRTYLNIAPMTDDLWLSKILEKNGTQIKTCIAALTEVQEITNSGVSLSNANTLIDKNNLLKKTLKRIIHIAMGYFGVSLSNNDICMKKIEYYFLWK